MSAAFIVLWAGVLGCSDSGPGAPDPPPLPDGSTTDDTETPGPTGTGETGGAPHTDEVPLVGLEELKAMEQPLQGLAFHKFVSGLDHAGVGTAESPFFIQQMEPAPLGDAFGDLYSRREVCYLEAEFDVKIKGSLDVGRSLTWTVGDDEISLKRDLFAPGQLLYVYDPERDPPLVGEEPGAEIVIADHPTGVHVPERLVLDPTVWPDFLAEASSVLDWRWTPADDPDAVVVASARLYETVDDTLYIFCVLDDDGAAIVDTGLVAPLWGLELTISRLTSGVVDHPVFGPLHVSSERYIRAVAHDIQLETP